MATDRQIEANRNNAQLSTGPRTLEGKQRSAKNAVTHGLAAKDAIIPGEDRADYDDLLLSYGQVFGPSDPYEHTLIRQMADAEWRLRRISRLEAAFISSAFGDHYRLLEGHDDESGDDTSPTYLLGKLMQTRSADFTQFTRYEAQLRRSFQRAFKLLFEFRDLEYHVTGPAYQGGRRKSAA
jgi:hypothetical protein